MGMQIFGTEKCFDTKKAQRYFKERGVLLQFIDLKQKGMSKGELKSVITAVGDIGLLADPKTKEAAAYHLFQYLSKEDQLDKLVEVPLLLKTPIVRNGSKATIGYQPDIWKTWNI